MVKERCIKYVGDILNNEGLAASVESTIAARKGFITRAIYDIRSIVDDCRSNITGGLKSGLELWELSVILVLLNNSETWQEIRRKSLENLEKLQIIFDRVNEESENKGLKINIRKTKCMVITKKDPAPSIELRCGNQTIETVTSFNYLGSMITTDARSETEIKRRIGIAKNAFRHMQNLLTNRKLSIKTRKGLIKTHIWSTLLYGAESWTLSTGMRRKLEAMELWLWRRMMKIPWTARKTNEEVLRMVGEKRNLMIDIRKRQFKFFGHIMRREGLENTIITGMVEGKRGRGRPRTKYIDGLIALTRGNMTAAQFLRITKERREWKSMVADVLEDMAQR